MPAHSGRFVPTLSSTIVREATAEHPVAWLLHRQSLALSEIVKALN